MNIELEYQKIIKNLAAGSRALVKFTHDERTDLLEALTKALDEKDPGLEKILCLIDHSVSDDQRFEGALLRALDLPLSARELVFTLNCARKHILQARFKRGNRLDFTFLEALKKLLSSDSPEVVEWTLRTIEECGNQGVYFLQFFDKIKPPPWRWFNSHQRAVRELITMLERRWSRFEKET